MGTIISLFNQKGGVGKTTINVNLTVALAKRKQRVLTIDLDPQGNTTSGFGVDASELVSSYDVFLGEVSLQDAIVSTEEGVDLIPSSPDLAAASMMLSQGEKKDYVLKEALQAIQADYDLIFIDCPPALGLLSINALVASDTVLIPIQCEFYALEGLSQLVETIQMIRSGMNPNLSIEGVLLNMVDKRNNLTRDVAFEVKKYFGDKVYDTEIPRNVRLAEAPSYGQSIFKYDSISKGAWSFKKLAKEFLQRRSHG